jgi:hypothetical protein
MRITARPKPLHMQSKHGRNAPPQFVQQAALVACEHSHRPQSSHSFLLLEIRPFNVCTLVHCQAATPELYRLTVMLNLGSFLPGWLLLPPVLLRLLLVTESDTCLQPRHGYAIHGTCATSCHLLNACCGGRPCWAAIAIYEPDLLVQLLILVVVQQVHISNGPMMVGLQMQLTFAVADDVGCVAVNCGPSQQHVVEALPIQCCSC